MSVSRVVKSGASNAEVIATAGLGGAGVAAIAALLREYKSAKREERRNKKRMSGDDENTIFLNLPPKKAEKIPDDADNHARTFSNVRRVGEEEETLSMHDDASTRYRDIRGRFSGLDAPVDQREKDAGMIVNSVSLLAGIDQLSDMKNRQLDKKLEEKAKGRDRERTSGGPPKIRVDADKDVSDDEAVKYLMAHRDKIVEALGNADAKARGNLRKRAQAASINDRIIRILGGTAAAAGGYYLVDKLSQEVEKRRLKRQLEAVRNEYIGTIVGGEKAASDTARMLLVGDPDLDPVREPSEKTAEDGVVSTLASIPGRVINGWKDTVAVGGAGYIGTALLTAYLTKKLMDYKFGTGGDEDDEKPEGVKRIVFRTMDKQGEAHDMDVDPETMFAFTCMYMKMAEDCNGATFGKSAAPYPNPQSRLDATGGVDAPLSIYTNAGRKAYEDDARRQYYLEQYAKENGWLPDDYTYMKSPDPSWKSRFAGESGMAQARQGFFEAMRKDPTRVLKTLSENEALRNSVVHGSVKDGLPSWLSWIPGIDNVGSWLVNNTSLGRRYFTEKMLERAGMPRSDIDAWLKTMDFSNGNWGYTAPAPAPAAKRPVDPRTVGNTQQYSLGKLKDHQAPTPHTHPANQNPAAPSGQGAAPTAPTAPAAAMPAPAPPAPAQTSPNMTKTLVS